MNKTVTDTLLSMPDSVEWQWTTGGKEGTREWRLKKELKSKCPAQPANTAQIKSAGIKIPVGFWREWKMILNVGNLNRNIQRSG